VAILYVEDDALTRQAIAGRLRRRGHTIIEATSGEEALNLAGTTHPCLALLDIDLPGVDGVETYRKLLEMYPRLPAVVCSATLTSQRRKSFQNLGVPEERLLAKPCPFDRILAAIDSVGLNENHNGQDHNGHGS
jgi:CheY-like chemotaxis protein